MQQTYKRKVIIQNRPELVIKAYYSMVLELMKEL